MSANNSQGSGSSTQHQEPEPKNRARESSRYSRAAQAAATVPTDRARSEPKNATREHARQDRDNLAAEREKRGKAGEIDDVAALFGVPKTNSGGNPPAAADRRQTPPRPGDESDAGRSDDTPPRADRPALEFDDDDGDEEPGKRRKKANTLQAFVEEHELDAKAVYDLEISLEEGDEPVTIGKLKDHYKETRDHQARVDEFEDWQAESQNEIIASRAQIENVMQRLTQVVPPEAMARALADMQIDMAAKVEKAKGQIREWFPEWADVQVKARDREKLETAMSSYGFSRFEVGAVNDARLIKFAMDAIRLMERHKRLREGYEREKKPSKEPTSSRPARRQNATDRAKSIAATGDKVGAVASLLGG